MPEQFGEKTQDATPHRRQQAREQGQVARSQDLASAVLLVAAILCLLFLGNELARFFAELVVQQLSGRGWSGPQTLIGNPWSSGGTQEAVHQWAVLSRRVGRAVLPLLGSLVLVAVATQLGQVGFLLLPRKLAPDLSRVSPLKGAQRLLSMTNAVRLLFGVFKIVVILAVAWWCVAARVDDILSLGEREVPVIAAFIVDITLVTCLKIGVALLILAILDYGYQRWKHEQDLRMTTQEVREEMKTLQGDPQIIARRRAVQRQLIANRLSTAVPTADVVVTNPTELAIAIQYNPETMAAPIVVAKGAGLLAQRIRRLALENGIPVVERKELARALYKQVELRRPIPVEQYAAVAEILRYVYQLKGKTLHQPEALAGKRRGSLGA